MIRRIALYATVALLFSTLVFALPGSKQYEAVWTANTEADLEGYYLYWRDNSGSFNDTDKVDCGLNTSQLLTGIVPNKTVLAITAYDTSGNESEFSAELPFDQDSQAPNSPSGFLLQRVP
jgi:hypothetical protein